MPEYLAPGVYVEETSYRSKSIEGVSTTTTGFVGPARSGPTGAASDVITTLSDFERVYGDGTPLQFANETTNFLWHGVRAFFENGGKRIYISRIHTGATQAATEFPGTGATPADRIAIQARHPGRAGNRRVQIRLRLGANALKADLASGNAAVTGLSDGDVVLIQRAAAPTPRFYRARRTLLVSGGESWDFIDEAGPDTVALVGSPATFVPATDSIRIATATVTVHESDPARAPQVWQNLALHPGHRHFGAEDSLFEVFAATQPSAEKQRTLPIIVTRGASVGTEGVAILRSAFATAHAAFITAPTPDEQSVDVMLGIGTGAVAGGDGTLPTAENYRTGLIPFEALDDISIVAAPGSTAGYTGGETRAQTIIGHLINHATAMRYRIAVLDSGDAQSVSAVRNQRAQLDSTYGALYYPWVTILDPITNREINLPPSGFVAGIYARNDINRAVYKAPANETVSLAIGFERLLSKGEQDVLNPEGINCFRFFEGRGFRLWGARTISSDPEWKYVNLRRYFAYLEHSIDKGTQWAVFEPNGERLWANVRRTVYDFMFNEWSNGALLGDKPEKAFFVRCDRSTMTQNDLDNGRLVCLIGLAPLRPAEFVIFRIGQWTADAKL